MLAVVGLSKATNNMFLVIHLKYCRAKNECEQIAAQKEFI